MIHTSPLATELISRLNRFYAASAFISSADQWIAHRAIQRGATHGIEATAAWLNTTQIHLSKATKALFCYDQECCLEDLEHAEQFIRLIQE